MKREGENLREDNYDMTFPSPRFDEQAKAMARPVVPLRRANGPDLHKSSTRGTGATILTTKNRSVPAVMITLAVSVVVVALIALFGNNETVSSNLPQTINGSASVIGTEPATENLIKTEKPDISNAPAKAPRESDNRGSLPVRYEIRRDDSNEEERRERDEDKLDEDEDDKEKIAKRARKEEKKLLERRRKEAEKLAERRRKSEERGETRPRLVGIYTEKP